jgi:hypothetical protein
MNNMIEESTLLDEVAEFLSQSPSPEAVLAYTFSDAMQARAYELADKNREGTLSADERLEMEQFVWIDQFVAILKAKIAIKQRAEQAPVQPRFTGETGLAPTEQ